MKPLHQKVLLIVSAVLIFSACKKNDHPHDDPAVDKEEYRHIRVLVSDGESTALTQVTPADASVASFEAKHPNATLYPTGNKRFGALLYGNNNFVQFFDCGLEFHGDHVDIKGTPKFAAITADGIKPTHFKSRGDETIIFNDGDGTLSLGMESDFHVAGAKMDIIDAGLEPHHGAMAQFDNDTYAVSVKDNASALAGPHGVKIIDKNGAEVYPVKMAVNRLHGNATDGKNALFGVEGGILVVEDNGEQRIIPNPDGFGDVRIGTVLEAAGVNKFIGFVAAKGAYFIDIVANKITPIVATADIFQCKIDYTGRNMILLGVDGTVSVYDLNSGSKKVQAKIMDAINAADTFKPALEATTKYIYAVMPSTGELWQISTEDLANIKKIPVSAKPSRLAILGYETNEGH